MANQTDIVVVDKLQKKAAIIDIATPNDSKMKRKEHKKRKKCQRLKEEVEKI